MSAGRFALILLVLGEVIQWGTILIGGLVYPGYDPLRQYISELGATGAVTGSAVSWFGFFPSGLLIVGFCLISAALLRRNPAAVVGLLLLAWYAFGLIGAAVYPCAFECSRAEPTAAQMMHDLIGGTGYLAGVAGVLLAALAMGRTRARWLLPLGLVCFVVALISFGGVVGDIEMRGLAQRILEAALTIFLLAVGWALATERLVAVSEA
jgi:hypothetical membrane protein